MLVSFQQKNKPNIEAYHNSLASDKFIKISFFLIKKILIVDYPRGKPRGIILLNYN